MNQINLEFFYKSKNSIEKCYPNDRECDDINKYSITIKVLKKFINSFDILIPKKYQINTILKYFNTYFGINTNNDLRERNKTIQFDFFNLFYFDKFN